MKPAIVITRNVELSQAEQNTYDACLLDIAKGVELIETGSTLAIKAIKIVRDKKLFRITHHSFDAFCQDQLSKGRNYANKLIRHSDIIEVLLDQSSEKVGTIVPTLSEGATRELSALPPPVAAQVVKTASNNGEKVPTAKDIKAAKNNSVSEYFDKKDKPDAEPEPELPATTGTDVDQLDDVRKSLDDILILIGKIVRKADTVSSTNATCHGYVLSHSQAMRDAVEVWMGAIK